MFNAFYKVALLGRPNVGKSTLFNRLIRSNRAITHDRPGVTRDRMEGIVQSKNGDKFTLIDTGGVTLESESRVTQGPEELHGFEEALLAQAQEAVDEAVLLCFVVDGRDGLTPFDSHLADFLRKQNKPLLLVVNKVDGPERADLLMAEFHQLGFDILPVSASHGYNVRELEKEIFKRLDDIARKEALELAGGQVIESVGDMEGETEIVLPEHMQGATKRQKKRMLAELVAEQKSAREQSLADDTDGVVTPEASDNSDFAASLTGGAGDAHEYTDGQDPAFAEAAVLYDEDEALLDDRLSDMGDIADEDFPSGDGGFGKAESSGQSDQDDQDASKEATDETAQAGDDYSLPFYTADGPLRLALLGRPNVGKSSLVNAMVGEQRMIVSDIAGTTRDSVDVAVEIDDESCVFVDTAGVRRRSKIVDTVERYSVNSSLKSTTKAHVTLLMLDVSEGLTAQDKRLIELLNERKTPFMVLVNKVDLLASDERQQVEKDIKGALIFCDHVPVLFISVLKKRNLKRIVPLAKKIRTECGTRVTTGQLNKGMTQVLDKHQPPIVKGARAKFFYLTQAESAPPTFVFFVNSADRVLPSYGRYLEKSLRKIFGIQYAPVRLHFRSSHTKRKRKK